MLVQRFPLYEDRADVTLTSYVLDDSPEMRPGRTRPAIIICPGGGYLMCSDREAEPVALSFAAMGYHAFVLRYSVYAEPGENLFPPQGELQVRERSLYPAAMRDLAKAILFVREHAEKWLVDAARIGICGFSAGAHNCAMYAVNWKKPVLTGHFGVEAEQLRPALAILCYPVCDYQRMAALRMARSIDDFALALSDASAMAMHGTKCPSEEQLKLTSPVLHVNADTPPMFLWATSEDALVPVENTTRMATALAAEGIPFEAHIFEGGPHGLSLATQATANRRAELDADAAKWLPLAESWLYKRFALLSKRGS